MAIPSFPNQPDLNPREVATLAGLSYWTVLREVERGNLKAYRRPGNKLAVRRDDFCEWAYGDPVTPKERETPQLAAVRLSSKAPERGSVAALNAIEQRHRQQ